MSGPLIVRAPFCHTPANPFIVSDALVCEEDGGLLIRDGAIEASGPYNDIRRHAPECTLLDCRGRYLVPGLIDTHVHFPQLRIIGGLGRTLLDWLDAVALPEEARMADAAYARETATAFVQALLSHGTTSALVFGAHFVDATTALFETASAAGLRLASGLVLSDRGLRADLHQSSASAYDGSLALIQRFHGHGRLRYAVTPRFALSTSESMLEVCQTLVREYPDLTVQTHINEHPSEVEGCARAFPWAADYLSIYERYSLVGPRTVLAHDVHATDAELSRLGHAGASIAHCPCSNAALGSGIFPFRRHLAAGVRVALGSDVGGGTGFGILKEALQAYLMQRIVPDGVRLAPAHLLYLATRAGADALGLGHLVGDFSPGKRADFIVIDPPATSPLTLALQRASGMEAALAAILTMAGAESVSKVWIDGNAAGGRVGRVPKTGGSEFSDPAWG